MGIPYIPESNALIVCTVSFVSYVDLEYAYQRNINYDGLTIDVFVFE